MSLLEVDGLKVHFDLGRGRILPAVDGVSFTVGKGESFGIVGESGSGKSTIARALLRLVDATGGSIRFEGQPLSAMRGRDLLALRPKIQMIFQDPSSSLNPRHRAGDAVREPLDLMNIGTPEERDAMVDEQFRRVGLSLEAKRLFPHQFSGGQRQRLSIARAMVSRPQLVVCDEPVSALDVAIQAQVLNLLLEMQRDLGLTYVFISHDLAVIQYICTHVGVMYLGEIVEIASTEDLFSGAAHPYTWSLAAASLSPTELGWKEDDFIVGGEIASMVNPPSGCRFAPRCPFADDHCRSTRPALRELRPGHLVACHQAGQNKAPFESVDA